jgi:cytochrome c biogenesis protein ResB
MSANKPLFKFNNFIASPKLAIVLISLLGLISAVFSKQAEVFSSWWFVSLIAVLIINTGACTTRQFRTVLRTSGLQRRGQRTAQFCLDEGMQPEDYFAWAKQSLSKKGFRAHYKSQREEVILVGEKRVWAKWGSVIFHCGLLVCMTGALLSFVVGFKGKIGLAEKQLFNDEREQYGYIAPKPITTSGGFNRFSLYLDTIDVHPKESGTWTEGKVTLIDRGIKVKDAVVAAGYPLHYGNLLISDDSFGYFVVLKLTDATGNSEKLTLGLDTDKYPTAEQYTADLEMNKENLNGKMELYPDFVAKGSYLTTQSYRMDNPMLNLKLNNKSAGELYQGTLALGQEVTLADGRKLAFEGYFPWKSFWVIYDYGRPLIYLGFVIAGAGLLMLYVFVSRQVKIVGTPRNAGYQITVEGWTARFPRTYLLNLAELLSIERFGEQARS